MSRGLHFSSEASFAEISFQKVQKLGVIDRLGQVIAAAAFVTLLHVLLFSAGRQKDHRDPAGFFVLLEHTARFDDRKSTRLNSSHRCISYAVFCLKKKSD